MNDSRRAETLKRRLPELVELASLCRQCDGIAAVTVEDEIEHAGQALPIYSFRFGSADPAAPAIAFIGGVHGLERVGTSVVISHLKTVLELLQWDKSLQHLLSRCRISFLPLVNPAGMYAMTRANGRGIDLMRNAPLEAEVRPNVPLVGGHRLSPRLPWFRGEANQPLEREALALARFVRRDLFDSRFAIALDLHSGFGMVDRLWFPYAYSRRQFEHLATMFALRRRLVSGLPNHVYVMEPQSHQYVTHGDLWDHLFLEHLSTRRAGPLLPLTLEMGSWLWIKKNPRQVFSALGVFNPMIPHRLQRTLRRHLGLLDFLIRAVMSHENWATPALLAAGRMAEEARAFWYPRSAACLPGEALHSKAHSRA